MMAVDLAVALPDTRLNNGRKWPLLLVLYTTLFPAGAALTTLAYWPLLQHRVVLALGSEYLSLALLAAGILLLDEPAQQRPALMLIASSALLTAGWLNEWRVGPLPLISVPASPLGTVLASWAMFRYPYSPAEMRSGRRFFTGALAWLAVGECACIALSRPRWNGFSAAAWWPTLLASRPLFAIATGIVNVGYIVFSAVYVLLWVRRWRRSRGISRRLALPIAVAAITAAAATMAELIATSLGASKATFGFILTVEAYVQIGVPAAFLISVLRRRFARTRIVELLLRLRGPTRAASVTDALRSAFEDPGLEILDWAPGTELFAGDVGSPPVPPGDGAGRLRLPITSSSGQQLAVVLADPSLSANDDLVRAAIAASSFALENAQLQAALRAQLQETRDSRLRIIEAGVSERRRLERDLHDGTQQRLLALKIMLAAAESDETDQGTRALIARIRSELGLVVDELRDLANGIHPAVLSQVGLDQAIKSMAERYTVPIDVSIPPGRFPDTAELTAYFVIAESVTNSVKHARARRIGVRGDWASGFLRVEITDDGQGGACADAGTGIRGIIDRVRGIGGDLVLDSPPGAGTRIEARIPCA
jgi:signal transduction histidine kinase